MACVCTISTCVIVACVCALYATVHECAIKIIFIHVCVFSLHNMRGI